jgi:hypothetical protein
MVLRHIHDGVVSVPDNVDPVAGIGGKVQRGAAGK